MIDNALFFAIEKISNLEILVAHLQKQNILFSYFQVNQNYYLFCCSPSAIQVDFLYQSLSVIQELDSKQRTIRSLRGFLFYALEIIESGKDFEVLSTNLPPFFWRKIRKIIRKNQPGVLQQFVFRSESVSNFEIDFGTKIQSLQNQIDSLHERILKLGNEGKTSKNARRGQKKAQGDSQTTPQDDFLQPKKRSKW